MAEKEVLKQVLMDKIARLSLEFERDGLSVEQKIRLANSISQIILAYYKLLGEVEGKSMEDEDLSALLERMPKKFRERILRRVKSRRPGNGR